MKLPPIYKNQINTSTNQNISISNNNDIYKSFPIKVTITLNNNTKLNTIIVGKTQNYLITNNRKTIYIKNIKEILPN